MLRPVCATDASTGTVAGVYQSTTGSLLLVVVDTDNDNFGAYAADGLPDGWQVANFGTNNPAQGAPDAATNSSRWAQ